MIDAHPDIHRCHICGRHHSGTCDEARLASSNATLEQQNKDMAGCLLITLDLLKRWRSLDPIGPGGLAGYGRLCIETDAILTASVKAMEDTR
jgi:hypothetical protein